MKKRGSACHPRCDSSVRRRGDWSYCRRWRQSYRLPRTAHTWFSPAGGSRRSTARGIGKHVTRATRCSIAFCLAVQVGGRGWHRTPFLAARCHITSAIIDALLIRPWRPFVAFRWIAFDHCSNIPMVQWQIPRSNQCSAGAYWSTCTRWSQKLRTSKLREIRNKGSARKRKLKNKRGRQGERGKCGSERLLTYGWLWLST